MHNQLNTHNCYVSVGNDRLLLTKFCWGNGCGGLKVQSLWRGVIVDRYGVIERGWRINDITLDFGCEAWRNIMKGWMDSYDNTFFRLGDERRSSFLGR